MRQVLSAFCLSLMLFTGHLVFSQIVVNSRILSTENEVLRQWAKANSHADTVAIMDASKRLMDRVNLYERMIQKHFLEDGMVVNRTASGKAIDHCDSLLFSSLRYISLKKLGMPEKAEAAWAAIEKSRNEQSGGWMRHPKCDHWTSRDMIVGLLAALTQLPPNSDVHLDGLVDYVGKNQGYIGEGPFYVSYLSPGLGEGLRVLIGGPHKKDYQLPPAVRYGFSTLEFDVFLNQPGYRSHLNSMVMWIELELKDAYHDPENFQFRSVVPSISPIFAPFTKEDLRSQRIQWLAQRLVRTDPSNMFFRYLRLRTADALTDGVRLKLMEELLAMEQFPEYRTPANCDRKADYMWQRGSHEYGPQSLVCGEYFNGVDFLWMTALLLDRPLERTAAAKPQDDIPASF